MQIIHHGGGQGVTGSCHELVIDPKNSLLIDCGLFQGSDASTTGSAFEQLQIDFDLASVQALLLTHCHLDHVGRIPYLLLRGFDKKIYCSEATARLLPLVLEDAVKIGLTRDSALISSLLKKIKNLLVPVPYDRKIKIPIAGLDSEFGHYSEVGGHVTGACPPICEVRFRQAGHILGSAYIEVVVKKEQQSTKVVFSGDLGAPYTPLLPSPKSPYSADILVLESTYGDRLHEGRRQRRQQLQKIIETCFENRGTVLIPAFSIGRTQELLSEIEQIIHQAGQKEAARGIKWEDLDIIVDSPLASRFTETYKELRPLWDREALRKVKQGRHPLDFEQLLTIDSHAEHLRTITYLQKSGRPAIVIAAGGMCSGGRIMNYLKALLGDPRTDIVFIGYQAKGTPGRKIRKYGPRQGYVMLDHKKYTIQAGVYTLNGYSAHADQQNLLRFVKGMRRKPSEIRLVHGEKKARLALQRLLIEHFPEIEFA
jgi:metallo-beta-lactamase family protein